MNPADVLVVGAGPTGLVLASELTRHGARVRIVEEREEPVQHSRAITLHARTLEMFEDMGVLRQAMEAGRRIQGLNVYQGRKRLLHLDMDEVDSPYPFILSIPQPATEGLLTQHLATQGATVERGVTLTGARQDDLGVVASLRHSDGREERCRTPWLVACDGGHSAVRDALAVPFTGDDVKARFALVDAMLKGPLSPDEGHSFFTDEGWAFFLALPAEGRWRIIFDVTDHELPGDPDLGTWQGLVDARVGASFELKEIKWSATFDIHQRLVDSLGQGRVFLAGDAAHVHSPVFGQGLNTGVQDAYNLAWKLALVIRGVGRPSLLESYDAERRPVIRALLRGTGQSTRVIGLDSAVSQGVRSAVGSFLGGLEVVQHRVANALGEVAISYGDSPLVTEAPTSLLRAKWRTDRTQEAPALGDVRDFSQGPRGGARAPDGQLLVEGRLSRLHAQLVGPHHTVLLFDGEAPTVEGYAAMAQLAQDVSRRYGELVRVCAVVPGRQPPNGLEGMTVLMDPGSEVHQRYGARAECVYAIRPDGYIGFRGQPIDGPRLMAWLEGIFL